MPDKMDRLSKKKNYFRQTRAFWNAFFKQSIFTLFIALIGNARTSLFLQNESKKSNPSVPILAYMQKA